MNPSEDCFDLIKKYEGCELKAYPDPATGGEPFTIGYGHTGGVCIGETCTKAQAEKWIADDATKTADRIQAMVKVPLRQNELDALTSLCYNIGMGNFQRSTLLKRLNESNFEEAADEFLKWNRGDGKVMPGLVKRRKAERELFLA